MSNDAITWAFKQTDLRSGPKFVLVVLADYADEDWSCFPGVAKIAERTGTSTSAARENLRRLEAAGCITTEQRDRANGSQSSNRYVLDSTRAPETGGGLESGGGTHLNPVGDPPASGGADMNPHSNPQNEPSASTPVVPAELVPYEPTAEDAFNRAWKVWPRKENRKLARDRFLRLARTKLRAEDLATAIARHGTVYAAWPKSEQEYVPYLSSWLVRERWMDPEPQPKTGQADRNVVDQGRRLYEQLLREERERHGGPDALS